MQVRTERRLLQAVVAAACLVPLLAGGAGIWNGPAMLKQVSAPVATDLDSHFRYLSGLLFGLGLGFAACLHRIEQKGAIFGTLSAIVILAGLARASSLILVGAPSAGHLFGLAMELAAVPLLFLWQRRVARRCGVAASIAQQSLTIGS